tara:strand:+ start:2288 stop:3448 length:1161 start_codon:yes stop_codon:yes gene_type:complete
VKFYLITNIFYIIFFLFIANVNAKECDKIWLIENLEVREINNDPSLAKKNAEKKVSKIAFEKLVKKIVLNSSTNLTELSNKISYQEINSMIDFRLIKFEKTLSNRYIGNFDFCFRKDKITNFLKDNLLAWTELYSSEIIVLPVWKNEFGLRLWDDPNPLKNLLEEKIKMHKGLTNLIFPKNRIGVLRSIDANLAYFGDEKSISRVIKRSGASRALNMIFELEKVSNPDDLSYKNWVKLNGEIENPQKISVTAFIHNKNGKKLNSFFKKNSFTNIENLPSQLKLLLDEVIFHLEENWKKANIFMGDNTDDVQIFIYVTKIKNWVKAINKLKSLPGIKNIITYKLTNEGAFVTISVEGGLNRFISIVFENKLPFTGPKEKLILNSDKL